MHVCGNAGTPLQAHPPGGACTARGAAARQLPGHHRTRAPACCTAAAGAIPPGSCCRSCRGTILKRHQPQCCAPRSWSEAADAPPRSQPAVKLLSACRAPSGGAPAVKLLSSCSVDAGHHLVGHQLAVLRPVAAILGVAAVVVTQGAVAQQDGQKEHLHQQTGQGGGSERTPAWRRVGSARMN